MFCYMGIKCWLKKKLCQCLKQDEDDDPPYGQVDELHDEELSVVNLNDNDELLRDDEEELSSFVNHDDNDELLHDDELSVNHDFFLHN